MIFSDISDSDIAEDDDDMHLDPGSPIRPKWAKKTLEDTRNLVGNPLDPRKTRSQSHIAFFACEVNISEK